MIALGWAALPASYRIPEVAPTLDEARAYCKRLAESHYENFHVATWFLPKALRPHFHAIYAYCRISDDLGDEVGDTAQALALLELWEQRAGRLLRGPRAPSGFCRAGRDHSRLLHSQGAVCRSADGLSPGPDRHPLRHHGGRAGLLPLLGQSGGPAGALCLRRGQTRRISGLSDATCSALQLANFWQDVRQDYARGRVYLPQKDMEFFGVSDETIAAGHRHAGVSRPDAPARSILRAASLRRGCR